MPRWRSTPSHNARDEALEAAFARSDAAAYDTAYRNFRTRLDATAMRILRDRQSAQDCVHDVMLRLWKRGNAYTPARGSLEAFLTVCVRNEALMRVRNGSRQAELRTRLRPPEDYRIDSDPIERERIARAVGSLTPIQFTMIDCAYYKAMTLSEIAAELQKPLGTVKSHIAAALRALRAQLVEESTPHA